MFYGMAELFEFARRHDFYNEEGIYIEAQLMEIAQLGNLTTYGELNTSRARTHDSIVSICSFS